MKFGWWDKNKQLYAANIHIRKQTPAKLKVHPPVLYTADHVCKLAPENTEFTYIFSLSQV